MVFSGIKIRFFVRYNAIIKPLKPRLSKFRTILTAGATWVAGRMTFHLTQLYRDLLPGLSLGLPMLAFFETQIDDRNR